MAEIGEASAQDLAAHLEQKHGVKIDARFIPFLRASLLEAEVVEKVRQSARMLAEQAVLEKEKGKGTLPEREGQTTSA